MDLQLDTKNKSVNVIRDESIIKTEAMDKDSLRDYMLELTSDDKELLEALRTIGRKFKPNSYTFKEI